MTSSLPPSALVQVSTPHGPFTIIHNAQAVLASGWTGEAADLMSLIHPSLRPTLGADPNGTFSDDDGAARRAVAKAAIAAVEAYYDGELSAPARVAVHQVSGPFRMRAWEALREVQPGKPVTYTELATASGKASAVRAAAGACASNAAALFVPCHRVLRSDGSLGGFRYGAAIKQSLLDAEAGALPSPQ